MPSDLKNTISRFLGAAVSPIYSGIGSIFCFHRVLPEERRSQIGANRALEVTPEFLEDVITYVHSRNYDIITLDAVVARVGGGENPNKFVCFTFDDGYLDNLEIAYPILKRHGAPFTVYLTTSFVDGKTKPWWYLLEHALTVNRQIRFLWNDWEFHFDTATRQQRETAFDQITALIRNMDQTKIEDLLRVIAGAAAIDLAGPANAPIMTWDQVKELSSDKSVTIGAHTLNHYTLNKLDLAQAACEIGESKKVIESRIGKSVAHFSYPFGGRNAVDRREFEIARGCGFKSMTTTRQGNLFPAHREHLDCLPRHTVSGNYPTLTHVQRLLSGMDTAWDNPFGRVVTA